MLTGHHYQNAYIVDDIEAAITACAARGAGAGVRPFAIEQQLWTPSGMKTVASKLAFIWLGDMQIELIEVVEDQTGIYHNWKDNGGGLHFHHSCTRVADWEVFRVAVDQQDLPVVLERADDPYLKFVYLDGRAFCGHYLEYTWMTDERWVQLGGPA